RRRTSRPAPLHSPMNELRGASRTRHSVHIATVTMTTLRERRARSDAPYPEVLNSLASRQKLDAIESLRFGNERIEGRHDDIGRGEAAAKVGPIRLGQIGLELRLIGVALSRCPIESPSEYSAQPQRTKIQRHDRRHALPDDKDFLAGVVEVGP